MLLQILEYVLQDEGASKLRIAEGFALPTEHLDLDGYDSLECTCWEYNMSRLQYYNLLQTLRVALAQKGCYIC